MLDKMRGPIAKFFVFVLFGLLILSFALWGVGDMFRGGGDDDTVVKVGDVEIGGRQVFSGVSRQTNVLSQQLGTNLSIEDAVNLGVVQQVLQPMIARALFDQLAADLGMVASQAQIERYLASQPAFRDEQGRFSGQRFLTALRSLGMTETQYLAQVAQDIERGQIADAVTSGTSPSPQLVDALLRYRQEQRVAEIVTLPVDPALEVGRPDEPTLTAYYEENQARYNAPERRSATVLMLGLGAEVAKLTIPEDRLRQAYQEREAEFGEPERRALVQVVLPDEAAAQSLLAAVDESAGLEAAASAEGLSVVPLGSVSRADLEAALPALAEVAFGLEEGAAGGPVESAFGWHVVEVQQVVPAVAPSYERARPALEREMKIEQATDTVVQLANEVDEELALGSTLEEISETLNLPLVRVDGVSAQARLESGEIPAGLVEPATVVSAIFAEEPGAASPPLDLTEGGYFSVRVDEIVPAAPRPLEEVREEVIADWQADQRREKTRERAEALAQRARDGEVLADLATAEALAVEQTDPLGRFEQRPDRRQLASAVFGAEVGEIVVAEQEGGYILAKVVREIEPDPGASGEARSALTEQLGQSLDGDILAAVTGGLREQYPVEIDQRRLAELFGTP